MDGLLILVLLIAFAWLLSLQINLSEERQSLATLSHAFEDLRDRLRKLEHPTAEPTQIPRPATKLTPAATSPDAQAAAKFVAYRTIPSAPNPDPPASPKMIVERPKLNLDDTPIKPVASPEPSQPGPIRNVSLEERLGQNWLNKLGIVTLVLGLALFLGYRLQNLGPLGKSLIGIALSLALLAGGLLLERRDRYRIFARACIGGGWALTFFVTFAMYHVQAMKVLQSQGIDLVLMLAVAAAMVWHSLRYKSQVVTSLAFLLAFVTVGISQVTLFSLVAGALLAAGLIYVAARQRWFELSLAGLVGVFCNHFLWLQRVLPNGGQPGHPFPHFAASAGLLLLDWLLFRLFFIFRTPANRRQEVVSVLGALADSACLLTLLKFQSSHPEWAFAGLLALGSLEMTLAFIARPRWRNGFLVLAGIASALLIAAIPFRFSGSSWTLLWLLQAELLFVAGIAIRESIFRRIGTLTQVLALLQLAVFGIIPIFDLRQLGADPSHHTSVAMALFTAAALLWFNAEAATRRWSDLFCQPVDEASLKIASCLAATAAALGLWVFVPAQGTTLAWLAASTLLAFVATRIASIDLATQADALALAAIVRTIFFDLTQPGTGPTWHHITLRAATVTLTSTLLYANMRRSTHSHALPAHFIATAYSWAASALLGGLILCEVPEPRIALVWGALGLALFELGTILRKPCLRHQAYALFAATFARSMLLDLQAGAPAQHGPRMYKVLLLVAAYLWVYERTRRTLTAFEVDRYAGRCAAWLGVAGTAALLYRELPPEQIVLGWAALAFALLLAACWLMRPLLELQSLAMLAAVATRAAIYNLALTTDWTFWHSSRIFTVGTACATLLLCLPCAFLIRRTRIAAGLERLYTEQAFFFVPVTLGTMLMTLELHAGMITVGWSALGLAVFLFALLAGERSYRLSGLALLMLGLAKIVLVDIWSAAPIDRYITLIVTGLALLLVSFLYSRYRETVLKLL